MKHLYLFPMFLTVKVFLGSKMIYWGQGRDLAGRETRVKNLAYATEQGLCDAIILYAERLKKYVPSRFHKKVFVANDTLYLNYPGLPPEARDNVLAEYGIHTKKNIICVGRLRKRKRLEHLVAVHAYMNRPDIGLILVGPNPDGILKKIKGDNIYKLGPIYGEKKFDLLSAVDVCCLPGAVGLSMVDTFHCGLPFVPENGFVSEDHAPEGWRKWLRRAGRGTFRRWLKNSNFSWTTMDFGDSSPMRQREKSHKMPILASCVPGSGARYAT